jgi:hypothetical protein
LQATHVGTVLHTIVDSSEENVVIEIDFVISGIDVDHEAIKLFGCYSLEGGQSAKFRVGKTGQEGCLGDSQVGSRSASEKWDNKFSVKSSPFLVRHTHIFVFVCSVPNGENLLSREAIVLTENLYELFAGMLTVFRTFPSRDNLGKRFGDVEFKILLRLDNQFVHSTWNVNGWNTWKTILSQTNFISMLFTIRF